MRLVKQFEGQIMEAYIVQPRHTGPTALLGISKEAELTSGILVPSLRTLSAKSCTQIAIDQPEYPCSQSPHCGLEREHGLCQKAKDRLVHFAYSELRSDLNLKPGGSSFLSVLVFSLPLPLSTCSPPWLPSVTVTDDWTRIRRESQPPIVSSPEN